MRRHGVPLLLPFSDCVPVTTIVIVTPTVCLFQNARHGQAGAIRFRHELGRVPGAGGAILHCQQCQGGEKVSCCYHQLWSGEVYYIASQFSVSCAAVRGEPGNNFCGAGQAFFTKANGSGCKLQT